MNTKLNLQALQAAERDQALQKAKKDQLLELTGLSPVEAKMLLHCAVDSLYLCSKLRLNYSSFFATYQNLVSKGLAAPLAENQKRVYELTEAGKSMCETVANAFMEVYLAPKVGIEPTPTP